MTTKILSEIEIAQIISENDSHEIRRLLKEDPYFAHIFQDWQKTQKFFQKKLSTNDLPDHLKAKPAIIKIFEDGLRLMQSLGSIEPQFETVPAFRQQSGETFLQSISFFLNNPKVLLQFNKSASAGKVELLLTKKEKNQIFCKIHKNNELKHQITDLTEFQLILSSGWYAIFLNDTKFDITIK
jgi:hypothetical protein